jgi:hypothetical protein
MASWMHSNKTPLRPWEHSSVTRDAMQAPELSGKTKAPVLISNCPVPSVFTSPSQQTKPLIYEPQEEIPCSVACRVKM